MVSVVAGTSLHSSSAHLLHSQSKCKACKQKKKAQEWDNENREKLDTLKGEVLSAVSSFTDLLCLEERKAFIKENRPNQKAGHTR